MKTKALIVSLTTYAMLIGLFGCGEDTATAPEVTAELSRAGTNALAAEVRQLTAGRGTTQLPRPPQVGPRSGSPGTGARF